ncbi:MAG: hypothetical protein ACKO2C_01660 [Actinomycetes bacterium]
MTGTNLGSRSERGSAVIELAVLGALCFGLLIEALVVFGQVQRAALATTAAARDAGRAVVVASTEPEAAWRARAAVVAAERDHGLADDAIELRVTGVRDRGALLRVEARAEVRVLDVPLLARFLPGPIIPVVAAHRVRLERFASIP